VAVGSGVDHDFLVGYYAVVGDSSFVGLDEDFVCGLAVI
jgi:hypothetical protein